MTIFDSGLGHPVYDG